jgi:hypothetical protein
MAPLVYRPRPKLHSWTVPEPPKPRRSRFYLWAVAAWLGATALGYHWLSTSAGRGEPETSREEAIDLATARDPTPDSTANLATTSQTSSLSSGRSLEPAPSGKRDGGTDQSGTSILPCEQFLEQTGDPVDSRLPAHLGRSALDVFIGENAWARPCRTRHRIKAELCIAIRDGSVRGLSVRTSPPNLTLETCLREQAAKLVLQPESNVRVIRTTVFL